MISSQFLNALVKGTEGGAIYAIFALGLVVVYQATGVFNFAQGESFMAGSVLGVILWQSYHLPLFVAFVVAMLAAAVMAAFTERVAVRPSFRFKGSEAWLLSTLGVSLIIERSFALAIVRHGDSGQRKFPQYLPGAKVYRLSGVIIESRRAFVVIIALVTAALLSWFMRRTQIGRALRAVAADREGASLRGLPVANLGLIAFTIAGAIGGIGGFVAGPVTTATVYTGLGFLLKGFMAGALGGFSIAGALLGGFLLGVTEQMTATYTDGKFNQLITLGVLLGTLTLRPRGILATKARVV